MVTEHTYTGNNDGQEPGAGQLSASITPTPATDSPALAAEQTKETGVPTQESAPATPTEQAAATVTTPEPAPTVEAVPVEQRGVPVSEEAAGDVAASASTENVAEPSELLAGIDSLLFPLEMQETRAPEEAVRPFTDFIEEFRQIEGPFHPLSGEIVSSFATSEDTYESLAFLETLSSSSEHVTTLESAPGQADQPAEEIADRSAEVRSAQARPGLSPERPVSPLLRPAIRPRLPRHSRHRIDELLHPAEMSGNAPAPVEEAVLTSETTTPAVLAPTEVPARPARRYRFDRPATTASVTPTVAQSPAPTPVIPAEKINGKEKRGNGSGASEEHPGETPAQVRPAAETPAPLVSTPETAPTGDETPVVPATPAPERRRRASHERARSKETAAASPAPVPAPAAAPEPVVELAPATAPEVAPEELPPLEYADLQAASSRRRRRRGSGRAGAASTASAVPSSNGVVPPKSVLSDLLASPSPTPPVPAPMPSIPPAYNIVSGYTVSQMNQGNEASGPFMGPEPSPARGSAFAENSVRRLRGEPLKGTAAVQPARHAESPLMSTVAVNHLANVVAQAMQTQTDRMVAEMRRANQVPTNVSVSLPPFPSTERVGVFVDVANLLYSARTLRMTIDFGKLLDFLRGNRRLVRAQAYCPTSPQLGDDQMFLQAVKGLGYRITTKNYKVFASGAKKADLDLDLCMDVVRLVDGKAVDCIVLVSGDSDFMPMLDYCSDHGVRVEVAAFDESMSATLRQSCDLFVNLSMLEEIRS